MFDFKQLFDRSDAEKWAHPELNDTYANLSGQQVGATDMIYNQDLTPEMRQGITMQFRQAVDAYAGNLQGLDRREIVSAPGCEEEPDTPVELVIYRPLEEAKKKLPILYFIPGGGMYITALEMGNLWKVADRLNCLVVCPRYRNAADARYPAAINDCHAGYNYIAEHAKEYGANAKRIVVSGSSSGSHLALSLLFRLKRYGVTPRGCVVYNALPDNNCSGASHDIFTGGNWNARCQFMASIQYVGGNQIGDIKSPEVYPIYATVDDCVGLCPVFVHADAEDSGMSSCKKLTDTLSLAGVYNELHVWGGSSHSVLDTVAATGGESDYAKRYSVILDGNYKDCWNYDLSRSWIKEL